LITNQIETWVYLNKHTGEAIREEKCRVYRLFGGRIWRTLVIAWHD